MHALCGRWCDVSCRMVWHERGRWTPVCVWLLTCGCWLVLVGVVSGQEGPSSRPYIPFEGRSTAQEAYQPKLLEEGPTFGARTGQGQDGPAVRPYIPFEGESVTKSSYP